MGLKMIAENGGYKHRFERAVSKDTTEEEIKVLKGIFGDMKGLKLEEMRECFVLRQPAVLDLGGEKTFWYGKNRKVVMEGRSSSSTA